MYENLVPVNFSKEIMKRIAIDYPKAISVFPVRGGFLERLEFPRAGVASSSKTQLPQADEIQTLPDHTKPQQAENREL